MRNASTEVLEPVDPAETAAPPMSLTPTVQPETSDAAGVPAAADLAGLLDAPAARVRRLRVLAVGVVAGLFFLGIPLLNGVGVVQDYKVNVLGKYLCFALVAMGLDLVWGYTGLLSLFQALFFCVGGYIMAMHLSLPQGGGDVRPEYNNIPQFMFFNNVHDLPAFWRPFASLPLTLVAGVMIPALLATVFGFFILRSRIRGVYFSIVTQAVAYGAWLLISRNEMLLGGTNGLTNFNKAFTQDHRYILALYLLTLVVLVGAYLLCRGIARSRLGRVLVAVRDRESRLYFAGYKPYAFKVFALAVGAGLAAAGGMLYAPQVGIISPQDMDVQASIFMVAWVAVGGRGRLWGAIMGALLVNYIKASLTSDMPTTWLLVEGMMFLGVVLLFPNGLVGLWERVEARAAAGAATGRVALAAAPLLALALFVLAEALGLMPRALMGPSFVKGVPWKYPCLLALLAVPVVIDVLAKRRASAESAANGFPVAAAATAGAGEVVS